MYSRTKNVQPSIREDGNHPSICIHATVCKDCFGPFYVKDGRLKRYGLLFTCMCSRTILIEMLDDLTSDAFLNALRCLIAVRGNISQLQSDQGTNFVGAQNEFKELMNKIEQERVKELGGSFVMNPPASSHMGVSGRSRYEWLEVSLHPS